MSATASRRLHLWLTIAWAALIIPAIWLWRESVPFLVGISVWANVAGHYASYQASRSEESEERFEREAMGALTRIEGLLGTKL